MTKARKKMEERVLEQCKEQRINLWFCTVAEYIKWDKYCIKYLKPMERLELAKDIYKKCGFTFEQKSYDTDQDVYLKYFKRS